MDELNKTIEPKEEIIKQKIITAWNSFVLRVKMLKRTHVFIAVLIVITLLLLATALFVNSTPPKVVMPKNALPSYAHTTLKLTTPQLIAPSTYQTTVQISTNQNDTIAVGLRISFDPKVLVNVDIKPGNFFFLPMVLGKNINQTTGTIAYDLVLPPKKPGVKGNGTVAIITFSTIKPNSQTSLNILPSTKVMDFEHGASVLKTATGITFNVK